MARHYPSKIPYTGPEPRPIYRHELPPMAWQVLWWLVTHMDEHAQVRGPWRTHAASGLGRHRTAIMRAARKLEAAGLVDAPAQRRIVTVKVANFLGD